MADDLILEIQSLIVFKSRSKTQAKISQLEATLKPYKLLFKLRKCYRVAMPPFVLIRAVCPFGSFRDTWRVSVGFKEKNPHDTSGVQPESKKIESPKKRQLHTCQRSI